MFYFDVMISDIASSREEKPKGSRTRKVCINSNYNLVIKSDKQKENRSNEKFDYISFRFKFNEIKNL